jgi:hypothetical protein
MHDIFGATIQSAYADTMGFFTKLSTDEAYGDYVCPQAFRRSGPPCAALGGVVLLFLGSLFGINQVLRVARRMIAISWVAISVTPAPRRSKTLKTPGMSPVQNG